MTDLQRMESAIEIVSGRIVACRATLADPDVITISDAIQASDRLALDEAELSRLIAERAKLLAAQGDTE